MSTQQFCDSIDFTLLTSKLKEVLNLSELPLQYSFTERGAKIRFAIESPNLIEHVGIMQAALREVYVQVFSYSVNLEEKKIWANITLAYGSIDGGTNGLDILCCWYERGKWSFKLN